MDDGARADRGVAGEVDMRDEPAAIADRDVRADGAIGADRDVGSYRRGALDPRRGIDHGRAHASNIMAPISASATIWPATLASPRYHHMVLRWAILFMWYSMVSPGKTGLRNFALSMVRKKTDFGCLVLRFKMQSTPAVCAMPSIISTPGNTGLPGKCPWNCGSLIVTFLIPMPWSSPWISINRSTMRNG